MVAWFKVTSSESSLFRLSVICNLLWSNALSSLSHWMLCLCLCENYKVTLSCHMVSSLCETLKVSIFWTSRPFLPVPPEQQGRVLITCAQQLITQTTQTWGIQSDIYLTLNVSCTLSYQHKTPGFSSTSHRKKRNESISKPWRMFGVNW